MNKILITILLSMFVPAFAACPVDADKPCTGENNQQQISVAKNSVFEPNDEEKTPFLPEKERVNNKFEDTQNQSYDPDCMFGVCLP